MASALFLQAGHADAETLRYSGPAVVWPEITAVSAFVQDPVSNVILYEKNADEVRSLASLSKIMTAAIVDDLIYNNPNLGKKVITIRTYKDENTADAQLKNGSRWLALDLVKYMLIGSSNKAAENLASQLIPETSFVSLMNFKAKEWGLTNTVFYNPSGLPISHTSIQNGKLVTTESQGGVSTAREAGRLIWNILQTHTNLLDITNKENGLFASTKNTITVANTDELVGGLNTLPIIAGKTGYTDSAGGNLAVVIQPTPLTHPHVIVVLGSTLAERFSDVMSLASSTPYLVSGN